MSKNRALVIVESPTKAKTIRKFLGEEYVVEASMGHIRDLPVNAQEIPSEYKKASWATLGINVEENFEPIYVISGDKQKKVSELQDLLKNCEALYLATDEDREGESIGWHLMEVLKPKVPTYRMVFHEITKSAIEKAIQNPRQLDMGLVQAQEARRVTDRLVGYVVSPLLWKKIAKNLSAGRVQSVAVKLLVQRERERIAFKKSNWWDLVAQFAIKGKQITAHLAQYAQKPIASSKDFDDQTGLLKNQKVHLFDEASAQILQSHLQTAIDLKQVQVEITEIERKTIKRSPVAPFTTSTLQQESNRKLGWSTSQTMRVAQSLYENGYITYMRTDSVSLANEAIDGIRSAIAGEFGKDRLSEQARRYQTSSKGAQEAHEAIRPAGDQMKSADVLGLKDQEKLLYTLIWQRALATQMKDAEISTTQVAIAVRFNGEELLFKASGREIVQPGFLEVYQIEDDAENKLPSLSKTSDLDLIQSQAQGHETRPSARFNEATLVKELEKEGVGRPSTYASIIETIQKRGYVKLNQRQLIPTFTGIAVTQLLEKSFGKIVDSAFTASMENWLDEVATQGENAKKTYLSKFYKEELVAGVEDGKSIDPKEICSIQSPKITQFRLRVGKFGPFVEYQNEEGTTSTFSIPNDAVPDEVDDLYLKERLEKSIAGELPLGMESDAENARPIYLKNGKFGPYVQLGDQQDPNSKKASIPKNVSVEGLQVEQALYLLSLPRELGIHPQTQVPLYLKQGPYGPYISYLKLFISLTKDDDLFTIEFDRALELVDAKLAKSSVEGGMIDLGQSEFGEISIQSGRFGPYLKAGKINVSIPKAISPSEITLEKAVEMIKEKQAKEASGTTKTAKTATKTVTKTATKTTTKSTEAKATKTPTKSTEAKATKTATKSTEAKATKTPTKSTEAKAKSTENPETVATSQEKPKTTRSKKS